MRRVISAAMHRVASAFSRPALARMREDRKQVIARVRELEQRTERALRGVEQVAEERAAKQFAEISRQLDAISAMQREIGLRVRRLEASRKPEGGVLGARIRKPVPVRPPQRAGGDPMPPLPSEIQTLTACPVCRYPEATPVCEFNRFLLLESAPDPASMLYDYALCHQCGVVFARHRPVGERYRRLVERFEEALGRAPVGQPRGTAVSTLTSAPLDDEHRRRLRERASRGVFVSEHLNWKKRRYLPGLLRDRLAGAVHVEILGSLLTLERPRVLELRPRFGSIGAALRRLYGADVSALPLFEAQQLLVREVYGIRADHLLNYDRFSIPYDRPFDLIIGNHMMTHAVHPAEFLATVASALRPGGHLYLYNEPEEADFLERGKSMFSNLNPFHLQTFDGSSLVRALRMNAFEPVFITHHQDNLLVLAQFTAAPKMEAMPLPDRDRRIAAYRVARDRAILRLPDHLRERFAAEWDEIVERAFAAGVIDYDGDGNLRLVKAASER